MTIPCSLKIRTPQFVLQLEGQADFVRSSYQAVRQEVLLHLGYTRTRPMPAVPSSGGATPSGYPKTGVEPGVDTAGQQYVWVYHCSDLYNKVHVAQRNDLVRTRLMDHVHLPGLSRIYLESEHADRLSALVPSGKTLWSELTPLGRVRLRLR